MLPTFEEESKLWKRGYDLVIGVDEVGRGCFAGPVVAGAVAFSVVGRGPVAGFPPASARGLRAVGSPSTRTTPRFPNSQFIIPHSVVIDDSKRLKPQEREKAAAWITENCLAYGIGEVGVGTINKVGIGKATAIAMRKAIASITYQVASIKNKKIHNTYYKILDTKSYILVDAFYIPYVKGIPKIRQKAIKNGDQKSISIAAASIIAKTFRDSLMQKLSNRHSVYGWGKNKGYGTRYHQEAIKRNGLTKLHRITFVETFLASQGEALRG